LVWPPPRAFPEFALESRFTAGEQAIFEAAEVESWRQSTKQREDALRLAEMQTGLRTMSLANQALVWRQVRPQLIESLRQIPTIRFPILAQGVPEPWLRPAATGHSIVSFWTAASNAPG
jgi:hypothetical protein